MEQWVIGMIVRYLLSLAVEELTDEAELKEKARKWIMEKISNRWVEKILLRVLDSVWDLILGEIKDELGRRGAPIPFNAKADEVWPTVTKVMAQIETKRALRDWS